MRNMADPNFSWIYLIFFLVIPLARIIPRLIARRKQGNSTKNDSSPTIDNFDNLQTEKIQFKESEKPLTKDKMVLRELNHGIKTFDKIQKNTGLDIKTLDSILSNLEKDGLMKVVNKQGIFGPKIELYLTEKGFNEYHS